jgi:hypothetical protein
MNRLLRSAFVTASVVGVAACIEYTPTSTGTTATNFAWIEGRVFSVSGQGIPLAQVGVRIPADRVPPAYQLQGGQTGATGAYDLLVQRIGDIGTPPTPDTLTVYVLVLQQVSGGTRLDSTRATLRFWPIGTVADPQIVDVHTEAP